MNSKEAPRGTPDKSDSAGEPPLEDQASTLSGVGPRAKGEFDPREGFYPQSLIPQIDALAQKERDSPLMAPLAPEPRRMRAAYWAVPLLLLGLFGAAYWYDRQGDVASPPRASGTVGPGPSASAVAPAPTSTSGAASGTDASGRSPPSGPLQVPSAQTNAPAAAPATAAAPASAPAAAAAPAPAPAIAAAPAPAKIPPATAVVPAKIPPATGAVAAPAPAAPAVVRVQPPPLRGHVAGSAPPTSRAQPAGVPPPAAAPSTAAGYTGGVTHTKGGANVEPAQPPRAAVPQAPASTPPASAGGPSTACTDSLAALGLCTPNRTGR